MTPLNYAASAVRDLRWLSTQPNSPDPSDVVSLAGAIETAVHFQLPDGGRLFEDALRGLRGREARLPYPAITVEYHVPRDMHVLDARRPHHCMKRLALAVEVTGDNLRALRDGLKERDRSSFENGAIVITVVNQLPTLERWVPLPTAWLMPMRWEPGEVRDSDLSIIHSHDSKPNPDEPMIVGYPIPHLVNWTAELVQTAESRGIGRDEVLKDMISDLGDEVCAVMALIEATTCSNVKVDALQRVDPALNARRLRDGKLPLYETKVLTLEVPTVAGPYGAKGGHHASPRQHLRRGHIRKLPTQADPNRQIWINSMVVGDPSRGKIDKGYEVRPG